MPLTTPELSRTVFAETLIAAPARVIWAVLVDLPHYGKWNAFAYSVESSLRVGDPITMRVRMSERWELRLVNQVRRVEPERLLCWGTCYPAFLLYGDRYQTLDPVRPAITRYRTWETYHGLLGATTMSQAHLLRRGFDLICAGLRARSEALYQREEVADGPAAGRR
jgi:hypothetical protein